MEKNHKLIDDEELEILDFDDDIEELPKVEVENKPNLDDDISIDDIIDIDDTAFKQINNPEPLFENKISFDEVNSETEKQIENLEENDTTPTVTEISKEKK